LAANSERCGNDSAFWDHGEFIGKRKTGSKDKLMDYVELLLFFMSAVAGLKIISDAIAWQRQQNYDGGASCVNLVPIFWVGW
jgi:hypothetical protein